MIADFSVARWGAVEIRGVDAVIPTSIVMFFCLLLFVGVCEFFGISTTKDVMDGHNPAALAATCGGLVSATLVFAGGNIGEGESLWENAFSIALGWAGLCAVWWFLEISGKISASITVERDLASGMRFCGFIVACGLILGRAVAGDWHSAPDTIHDFARDGWPACFLLAVAIAVERMARPSRARPFQSWKIYGVAPALCYIVTSIVWILLIGPWEGMH